MKVFGYTDIHWRIRNEKALEVAMKAQAEFRPDVTVIGGDLLDCEPFTRWPPNRPEDPIVDWVTTELRPASSFLDKVQSRTKHCTVMLEGNHDAWVERWAANSKTGKSVYSAVSPRMNLCQGRSKFRYVRWKTDGNALSSYFPLGGGTMAVHGWTQCKHAAAEHARLAKCRSVIFHHTHRMQMEVWRNPWTGEPLTAVSAGCLCNLQPVYAHGGSPTDWVHGFWVAYISKAGSAIYPVQIVKGKAVLPEGKEIRT